MSIADVTAAATAYGAEQYGAGQAAQQAVDAPQIASQNSQILSLQASLDAANHTIALENQANADLQAAFDAYKASHPDVDPPPPPPPSKPLYGGNFGSGPDESKYVHPVLVARLFPGSGYPTDLTTSSAYKEAKAAGAKVVILDFPAAASAGFVTSVVSSAVADGMTVLAGGVHEPEHGNKMTPADWVTLQVRLSPIIRAAGGKVVPILQAATVAGVQGRVLADYNIPAGICDYAGFDLYPKTQIITQDLLLPKMKAAAQSVYGCDQIVFGEYGVPGAGSDSVALIEAFQTWAVGNVYAAAYFSMNDTVLSTATAAAWFS